ncbi:MAG: hypothetical protein LBI33_13845, partial [Propionibacteriaceae bacterium]|nr:hypothetical protein [Propionibacteriaceae bacterium]
MMNRRQPHGSSRRPRPLPRLLQVKVAAPRRRIMGLLVVFVGLAVILAGRCLYVQGLDLAGNAAQALMPGTYTIPAARGTITDRNGQVMAESVPAVNITADPTIVATNGLAEESMSKKNKLKAQAAPGIIAGVLQVYLGGDFQTYYDKLTTTTTDAGDVIRYTMLARTVLNSVDLQITDYLGGLGYVGLFREQAPVRNYPNGTTAANVLGFMTYSDDLEKAKKYPWTGGEGLEYALNTGLTGVDGEEVYESSPYGRIPTGTSVVKTASQGV